jgi:hypothetical protein
MTSLASGYIATVKPSEIVKSQVAVPSVRAAMNTVLEDAMFSPGTILPVVQIVSKQLLFAS